MGAEVILGIIAAVLAIITMVLKARTNRKANRDALGKAEADELTAGMDRTDKLQPRP